MMASKKKILIIALGLILVLLGLALLFGDNVYRWFFRPTSTSVEQGLQSADELEISDYEIVASELQVPWSVTVLPDGDVLVTERPGSLKRISDGASFPIQGVEHVGEGGLLGLALDPSFEQNNYLYLYMTTQKEGSIINRIERYEYRNDSLLNPTVIIGDIPGASYHDGGRIAFGPDGMLYVTTGDAGDENAAQDLSSLAGKILRITPEGGIPEDNPFGTLIYSYGHRNPQGLAWDDRGRLWSSEHGPSGLSSGFDELNLIQPGGNYGWPIITGDEQRDGMISPVEQSGADDTWAPASLAFHDGSLFFAGLRGQSLYEAQINGGSVSLVAHLRNEYGRLREAVFYDGWLYITTSNTDGRGEPQAQDDKIIRINPSVLSSFLGLFCQSVYTYKEYNIAVRGCL